MTLLDTTPGGGADTPLLTSTLLTSLDRPPHHKVRVKPLRSFAAGLLTAGVWAAWSVGVKLATAVRWRRELFEHVATWSTLDGTTLDATSARDQITNAATAVARAAAVGAAVAAVVHVARGESAWRLWLIDPFRGATPAATQIAVLGLLGLSFAATWLAANLHRRSGVAFARKVGVEPPAKTTRWDFGFAIVPTTAAAILAWAGVTWALPMALAVTAARRSVLVHDRLLTDRVATAVRKRVGHRRPRQTAPSAVGRFRRCPQDGCGAPLAEDATFCPRCGLRRQGHDIFE